MLTKTYYEILQVPRTATGREIKKAYLNASKKWHPDANPGFDTTDIFSQINVAYQILRDRTKRERYDLDLDRPAQNLRRAYSTSSTSFDESQATTTQDHTQRTASSPQDTYTQYASSAQAQDRNRWQTRENSQLSALYLRILQALASKIHWSSILTSKNKIPISVVTLLWFVSLITSISWWGQNQTLISSGLHGLSLSLGTLAAVWLGLRCVTSISSPMLFIPPQKIISPVWFSFVGIIFRLAVAGAIIGAIIIPLFSIPTESLQWALYIVYVLLCIPVTILALILLIKGLSDPLIVQDI